MRKVERALISVSDKTGLLELGRSLQKHNIEIFSTGGTLKTLLDNGIAAQSVESYTGFPEMLDGRVKTLHPKIHGGILGIRDNPGHVESMQAHGIKPFDLVCINLYPFERVITGENVDFEEVVENIDIGGPGMIRAAAKNYKFVAVLTEPEQYATFMQRLDENNGELSEEYKFELMKAAFSRTAAYDSVISNYMTGLQGEIFPDRLNLSMKTLQPMRYGENPHQKAAFYAPTLTQSLAWKQLHGKELSYNNLIDLDIAIRVGTDFKIPVCAIFKHTNPCGVGSGGSQLENLKKAMATDPVSYFGGIVTFNETVQKEVAEVLSGEFVEIIVAPGFSSDAFSILSKKKNLRLIEVPEMNSLKFNHYEIRSAAGGFLLQETDSPVYVENELKVVSKTQPSEELIRELQFAFQVVKYVKSNAVVFSAGGQTLGIGAGQMSRVDSIRFAILKAENAKLSLQDSVLASDAFFPFRDGVDLAIGAGVKAIIQPGGSMRDEESIAAADEAGVVMVFTGMRHFRH